MRELKDARLGALADAEGWMPLVLAFERIGKYLCDGRKSTLGKARVSLNELASIGVSRLELKAIEPIPFNVLIDLVIEGRNEQFHGGSTARRFTTHCLELCVLFEDGLNGFLRPMKLKYLMTPSPTCAELDLPIYNARRLMLENSFSWLPIKHNGIWFGLSDHSLAKYTIQNPERHATKLRSAIKGDGVPILPCDSLLSFDEEQEVAEIMDAIGNRPVLVKANRSEHLVGIITSFDLL